MVAVSGDWGGGRVVGANLVDNKRSVGLFYVLDIHNKRSLGLFYMLRYSQQKKRVGLFYVLGIHKYVDHIVIIKLMYTLVTNQPPQKKFTRWRKEHFVNRLTKF